MSPNMDRRRACFRLSILLNVILLLTPLRSVLFGGSSVDELVRVSLSNKYGNDHYDDPLLTEQEDIHLLAEPAPPAPPPAPKVKECGICDAGKVGQALCDTWGEGAIMRGVAYAGSNHRLRRKLDKMRRGEPFSLGVIGGSVSAGHGLHATPDDEKHNMHYALFKYLDDMFPSKDASVEKGGGAGTTKNGVRNVYVNGAQPARGSDYFSMCLQLHLPPDVDVVVVELAINDPPGLGNVNMFENLIRSLLSLPSEPAVIMVNTFALMFDSITMGGDLNFGNAQFYDVPVLSTRNALLPVALQNHSKIADWFINFRGKEADPHTLENVDLRHFGIPGHDFAGDLMKAYIDMQLCEMDKLAERKRTTDPDELYPLDPLPRVRVQDKFDAFVDFPKLQPFCIATNSDEFPLKPSQNEGWREWAWKDKKYLVADKPGAKVTFDFTTSTGTVVLYYLRSWEFGLGNLQCWIDDDKKTAQTIEGYWTLKMNIGRTTTWIKVPPGNHKFNCEILEESADPEKGHEFRLMALMSI